MRTCLALALAALCLNDDGVAWKHDHQLALVEAEEKGKPVLLYFDADPCADEKQFANGAFLDKEVVALTRETIAVSVDIRPGHHLLYKKHGVKHGVSTLVLLDSKGRELARHTLDKKTSAADLAKMIRASLEKRIVRGTLHYKNLEGGVWTITVDGTTWCLHGGVPGFKDGDEVEILGRVRKDVFCIHMVGTVMDVESLRKP